MVKEVGDRYNSFFRSIVMKNAINGSVNYLKQ